MFLRYGSVDVALGWPLRYGHSLGEVIDTKGLEAFGEDRRGTGEELAMGSLSVNFFFFEKPQQEPICSGYWIRSSQKRLFVLANELIIQKTTKFVS